MRKLLYLVILFVLLIVIIGCDLDFLGGGSAPQGGSTIVIPNIAIEDKFQYAKGPLTSVYINDHPCTFYSDLGGKAYIFFPDAEKAYELKDFVLVDSLGSIASSSLSWTEIDVGEFYRILSITDTEITGVDYVTEEDVPYTNDGIGGLIGAGARDLYLLKRASYNRTTTATTLTATADDVYTYSMFCDNQKRINGVGYVIIGGLLYIQLSTYDYDTDSSSTLLTDIQPMLNVTGSSPIVYHLGFTDFAHSKAIIYVRELAASGVGVTYYRAWLYTVDTTTGSSTLVKTVEQTTNREYMYFSPVHGYPGMILYNNGPVFKLYNAATDTTYDLITMPGQDGNSISRGYRVSENSSVIYLFLCSDKDDDTTYSRLYTYDVSTNTLTLLYSYSRVDSGDRETYAMYPFYNERCLSTPNVSGIKALFPIKYARDTTQWYPLTLHLNQQYVD